MEKICDFTLQRRIDPYEGYVEKSGPPPGRDGILYHDHDARMRRKIRLKPRKETYRTLGIVSGK